MAKLVSNTYGEALFELAVEEGKEDEFLAEVTTIKSVLEENPQFAGLMNHPKILKEEKLAVIDEVFKGRISDELVGFLRLVVTKDRYSDIDEILDYYVSEVKKLKGIGVAKVVAAMELTDSQKKNIENRLLETTSFKTMDVECSVD